jgi:hypothetical protein
MGSTDTARDLARLFLDGFTPSHRHSTVDFLTEAFAWAEVQRSNAEESHSTHYRNEAARLRELANAVRDSQGLPFDNRVDVDFEVLCKLLVAIPAALSPHPSGERG